MDRVGPSMGGPKGDEWYKVLWPALEEGNDNLELVKVKTMDKEYCEAYKAWGRNIGSDNPTGFKVFEEKNKEVADKPRELAVDALKAQNINCKRWSAPWKAPGVEL